MEHQYRDESIFSLEVSPILRNDLFEAVKWGKFLAILGFIGTGLMTLFAIFGIILADSYGSALGTGNIFSSIFGFFFLLVIIALYFYPAFAMFKFCTLTKQGMLTNNQSQFEEGFAYLKRLLRYTGILTIVILSFYLLILFFVLIARF